MIFLLYFRLIFVKATSENVVAMATREVHFSYSYFNTLPKYSKEKSERFKEKKFSLFRSYAPETSRWGDGQPPSVLIG